jgi:hypothetical protein
MSSIEYREATETEKFQIKTKVVIKKIDYNGVIYSCD